MRLPLMLVSLLALTFPVVAQECLTPDLVLKEIMTTVPDAVLVKVSEEPSFYMEFSSPTMPTNLQVYFDENFCANKILEVADTDAS